ncbi:putative cystatin [Dioscorea sansibarensis]
MQSAHLEFKKVVKVTKEAVVEGAIYDIALKAGNLYGVEQVYEAKVWVKNLTFYKELLEFNIAVEINEDPDYIIDLAKFAVQVYNQWQI